MLIHPSGLPVHTHKTLPTAAARRITPWLLALGVAALGVVPSPILPTRAALAQSGADIERAKEQFFIGQKAYNDGDFLDAARAFKKAYEFSGRPELLYNIGKSYWEAKELKQAEDYFQQYINAKPDADNVSEVVEAIITIQQEMAAQMAEVRVSTSVAGVDIYVDQEGEARCKTPCNVLLLPGAHTLSARLGGGTPITQNITVKPEQKASMHFDLPGQLQVRTDQRSGSLSVAGQGTTPLPMRAPIALPAGAHSLQITGADGESWQGSVDIASGELTQVLIPMAHLADAGGGGMSVMRTTSLALAGLSLGLAAGGVFMGMQASDTHDALQKRQGALGSVDAAMVEQGRNEQMGANILYIASAVSLAAGVGLFTWDWFDQSPSADAEIPPSTPAPEPRPRPADDDSLLEIGGN